MCAYVSVCVCVRARALVCVCVYVWTLRVYADLIFEQPSKEDFVSGVDAPEKATVAVNGGQHAIGLDPLGARGLYGADAQSDVDLPLVIDPDDTGIPR